MQHESKSSIGLYHPICEPKGVADSIWLVDGPIERMAVGPISIPLPTRMVIVRLATGDLFVWSPTAIDDALAARVAALGRVAHLVSPNRFHYAHIGAWKARFPDSVAWASPGVRQRARSQNIVVDFDRDLDVAEPPPWAAEIDQLVFRGSRFVDEVVFFHRPSRTLLLADLVLNLEADKVRNPLRAAFGLLGAMAPDGRTPLEIRLSFLGRKPVARESLRRILAWGPERVVVAHGRCHDADGVGALRRAFRWLGEG